MSIRIGIMGYGNLGRGVEYAVKGCPDMELAGVFTRRARRACRPSRARRFTPPKPPFRCKIRSTS